MSGSVVPVAYQGRGHRGVALFVCLALLLVLGIAGASGVRTTILEERMARNTGDALLALQAAEAALREAEAFLTDSVDSTAYFTDEGTNGLWTVAPLGGDERWVTPGVWEPASGGSREVLNPVELVAAQPRFMIEWVATLRNTANPHLIEESPGTADESIEVFRITARGVGRTAGAQATVQSTFGLLL